MKTAVQVLTAILEGQKAGGYELTARDIVAALNAKGYFIGPIDPPQELLTAARYSRVGTKSTDHNTLATWRDMVASIPRS